MPTATSAGTPSTSSTENTAPSSVAIRKGADLLLKLFNEEQSQVALVYRENLEKRFNQFKAQSESQLTKNTALLGNLSAQYDKSVRDLEVTRDQLQHVRAEHAKLMASIEEVGLVYNNGALHFNDTTAKIVSEFREGTQMLDMVISHNMNSNSHTTTSSNPIQPSDFFSFLSGVTDNQYTHYLKMHQERQRTSLGGNMTSNDTALQDSEYEENLSLVWPSTYWFSTVSLSITLFFYSPRCSISRYLTDPRLN